MLRQSLHFSKKHKDSWNRVGLQLYNGLENMQNDIDVIKQVLAGDTEAFRSLVERYERPVLSLVQHLLWDAEDTEDLAQEVFLTAFKKLSSYDPALSTFPTWLCTIARNKTINANKKKRPKSASVLPEQMSRDKATDHVVQEELFRQLDTLLLKLPEKQRRAFVLSQIEQLPYEEIAQMEGTRIGTIKSRVNRARSQLQATFALIRKDHHD